MTLLHNPVAALMHTPAEAMRDTCHYLLICSLGDSVHYRLQCHLRNPARAGRLAHTALFCSSGLCHKYHTRLPAGRRFSFTGSGSSLCHHRLTRHQFPDRSDIPTPPRVQLPFHPTGYPAERSSVPTHRSAGSSHCPARRPDQYLLSAYHGHRQSDGGHCVSSPRCG